MARPRARHALMLAATAAAMLVMAIGGAVAAVPSGAAAAPGLTPANPPMLDGTITGYAGLCLDDYHSGAANGTEVDLYRCNNTRAQSWFFNYSEDTGGEIVGEIANDGSGKCLNDAGYGGAGSKVILWDCTNTSNEIWTYWSQWHEYSVTIGAHTYCMNDPAYSSQPGTQQIMWTCPDTANEQYTQIPWTG